MWRTGQRLLDILFPPRCPSCWTVSATEGLCGRCANETIALSPPLCTTCGASFPGAGRSHPCTRCLSRPPSFDRARACLPYETGAGASSPVAAAVHRYKYGPEVTLARYLGNLLADLCPYAEHHELILPVPLHASRLRRRGFNQALLLARPLARRRHLPTPHSLLVRSRRTRPQVGLSEKVRRRNMAGAFTVTEPRRVRNRAILLVDDVYTTGATLEECAATLRRAGAKRVDALVLLRARAGAVAPASGPIA